MYQAIRAISSGLFFMALSCSAQASDLHHEMNQMDGAIKQETYSSSGEIKEINTGQKKITIAHRAVPALNWPAMTMRFQYYPVADQVAKLKPGDWVSFSFYRQGGDYILQSIQVE